MTEAQVLSAPEHKELIKYIRQRASIKGRLTNFISFLNCIPTNQELTPSLTLEVEIRQSKLELLLTEFNNVQLQIEMIYEDPTDQLKEREIFETSYYKNMAQALAIINKLPPASGKCESKLSTDRPEDAEVMQLRKVGVKLPEIKLNKFDGTYSQWLEFRDMYDSMIHKNTNLMDITKFYYLRSYLEGSAALVIKSIEFSAHNYKIAWDLVCERYDNKRLLVANHVKSLFNVFPVQKESAFQLRRLIDTFMKNLMSLEILHEPTEHWDTLLIHILCNKLDTDTLREWEKYKSMNSDHQVSKLNDLIKFIRTRADMLETLEQRYIKSERTERPRALLTQHKEEKESCPVCKAESHALYHCKKFLDMTPEERGIKVKSINYCSNCLSKGHKTNTCKYGKCKQCGSKNHNTLLHIHNHRSTDNDKPENQAASSVLFCKSVPQGLLSTIVAQVHNTDQHKPVPVRAVLDSGSSVNLVTEHFCKKHNIPTRDVLSSLTCLNSVGTTANKTCNLKLKSKYSDFSIELSCLVIENITGPWPQSSIDMQSLHIPKGIKLADPGFNQCSHINLLIGNGTFWHLLRPNKIELPVGSITLFETVFGWVLGGTHFGSDIFCGMSQKDTVSQEQSSVQDQLEKFWKIESIDNNATQYSADELACENDFIQNTKRLPNGRFVVNIPLKLPPSVLGDTYTQAKQRFMSLERKFKSNPELKQTYTKFIHEYEQLGHMSETPTDNIHTHNKHGSYFAPHHAVMKLDSTTTKLRVVFDCSAKSTSGYSCNDLQRVGPTIQDDILSILLRFRQYNIALTSDIEKMYRQVLVNPEQRKLQQILWRDHPHLPLKAYELNTVTYGSAASAFSSIRCLKQLSLECNNPTVQQIIASDFYVDDLITGTNTVSQAIDLFTNLTSALNKGCFPLRKWRCNNKQVSEAIQGNTMDNSTQNNLNIPTAQSAKVLGLTWDSNADTICFTTEVDSGTQVTKRNILSTISQIFDPLGIVAPAVLEAKIMLQKLWLHKLSWDQEVPDDIKDTWIAFVRTLSGLNDVQVPRQALIHDPTNVQLHIFADASEGAYGACAYIRSQNNTQTAVHLLCAKGKVAPLKPITIPRMELCAALLGSQLLVKITQSLRVSFDHCFLWTDSSIVLGWLGMQPSRLHTFVRNRISEIQSTCSNHTWRHVPSQENPADLISRGSIASVLVQNNLWWNGPQFLKQHEENWPKLGPNQNSLPEVKATCLVATASIGESFPVDRFSNFMHMVRAFAYMLRFIHNTRNKSNKHTGVLTTQELIKSRNTLALVSQKESFPMEYKELESGKPVSKKSRLLSLNPFIATKDNLMRAGGRLPLSNYKYDKVHPVIISKEHKFTKLLFEYQHKVLLHAGPQHLLYSLRETYWTIGGRDLARLVSQQCLRCSRYRGQTVTPIMGNLPKERIQPSFPFELVGVDYAGPVMIADRKGRGCKLIKAYICIFVCFTTKAIHIELVGDMTTDNFIAALKRFISRRGKPSDIFCDNGTNFVGANNEIKNLLKSSSSPIRDTFSSDLINFHFLPPQSPHLGGLHEAGVRSVKHHLRRVLGLAHLTYEELSTTLTLIESLLNSRPLTPLSTNPNDFLPLTPGHFLVGRSLTALPEKDYTSFQITRLNRYQRIQQLRQHFWKRWQKEYISELQTRAKWKQSQGNIATGCLVVIKDNQLPPMKWLLGRITKVFPGKDNISRVAEIKTANGILKRDFTKICILPVEPVEDHSDDASTAGSMSQRDMSQH